MFIDIHVERRIDTMASTIRLFGLVCLAVILISPQSARAHSAFKKELGKKYPKMKVNCNACHVKKKPKTERTEFGKLFEKEFKGKELSAGFKQRKGAERKKYVKEVMVPAFQEALKKIKKMKNKDEVTYDELIKTGQIPEIKPKEADNSKD